jgi:hypothetical protein
MRKMSLLAPLCLTIAVFACNAPTGSAQPTPGITEILPGPDTPVPSDVLPTATETADSVTTSVPTLQLQPTPTLAEGGLTLEALKNATYHTEIAPGGIATLIDGHFQEPNPDLGGDTSVDLREPVGYGDINGDGVQDALVWLVAMTGNTTGRFGSLHAVLNLGGVATPVAFISLGDRVIVREITVAPDGLISVDMLIAGPNDGACCPNTPVLTTYRFDGTALVQYVDGLTATPYGAP